MSSRYEIRKIIAMMLAKPFSINHVLFTTHKKRRHRHLFTQLIFQPFIICVDKALLNIKPNKQD